GNIRRPRAGHGPRMAVIHGRRRSNWIRALVVRAVDVLGLYRREAGLARGTNVTMVDRWARAANGGPAGLRLLSLSLVGHASCQALLPGLHLLLGRLRRSLSRCARVLCFRSAFTTVQRNQGT